VAVLVKTKQYIETIEYLQLIVQSDEKFSLFFHSVTVTHCAGQDHAYRGITIIKVTIANGFIVVFDLFVMV
jgi:hypothetical protein